MKVREIIRLIQDDGRATAGQKGSHRQFKHPVKKGRVTVPGKESDTLHPKTLRSIMRQAGLAE